MHRVREGLRRMAAAGVVVSAVAAGAAGLAAPASGAAVTKSVVSWAEPPASVPNYIFPFYGGAEDTILNLYDFQSLMFRSLYYFGGKTASEALNPTLSLATAPVYSNGDKTVTISLKTYRWSNGEQVTSEDVVFWFNILHAEKTNYGNYVPDGLSIPTTITSITVKSPTTLTLNLNRAVNPVWFTNDQLWEVVPFPVAWTKTTTSGAAGSGGCASAAFGTADAKCKAVYTFLSEQAGYNPTNPQATNDALPTYASNPLWQVVDGPFHLTSFSATGDVSMAVNASYSGPNKPTYKTFEEKPYTTGSAEYNALATGQIDVGYLPTQDVTAPTTTPLKGGKNNPRVASTFSLEPLDGFRVNFIPYNFKSTGDGHQAAKIFTQLYFRQAMQELVDQPLYISRIAKGYAAPTYGPVPLDPPNPYVNKLEKSNPYPYDPAKAKSLLRAHGWKVVANGSDTCQRPGTASHDCGAGIKKGAKLTFSLIYASGTQELKEELTAEKSSWSSAGINVALDALSSNTVLGEAVPCPKGCTWELADWGAGYVDTGDPTEPVLFSTGAYTNFGSYSSSTADALIKATELTKTKLTRYEDYLAKQLPVLWEPNPATSLTEIHKGLSGIAPQDPIGSITPANWHWTS